jgi:hypothetical protein
MPRRLYPTGPDSRPGRKPPPPSPMAKLLMDRPCPPHEPHWPDVRLPRDVADQYALEWGRGLFPPDEVKQWLDAGAGQSDAPGAAALRNVGISPRLGCLRLFDDGTLRRGGIPLVARVTLGNISAEKARALLEHTGHMPVSTALEETASDVQPQAAARVAAPGTSARAVLGSRPSEQGNPAWSREASRTATSGEMPRSSSRGLAAPSGA